MTASSHLTPGESPPNQPYTRDQGQDARAAQGGSSSAVSQTGAVSSVTAESPTQAWSNSSQTYRQGQDEEHANEQIEGGQQTVRRKRRRRALACARCRARKVKCDFGYPSCKRCAEGPWPVKCVYESIPEWVQQGLQQPEHVQEQHVQPPAQTQFTNGNHPPAPLANPPVRNAGGRWPGGTASSESQAPRAGYQVDARRQSTMTSSLPSPATSRDRPYSTPQMPPPSTRFYCYPSVQRTDFRPVVEKPCYEKGGYLHGVEMRTRYHGCSSNASLLTEFRDLKSTGERAVNLRTMLVENIHRAQEKVKRKVKRTPELALDGAFLKTLLPPRPIVDDLLALYFQYFGRMLRVLHAQCFYKQLESLWIDGEETRADILVQLLLILAISWSMLEPVPLTPTGEPVLSHDMAIDWINWADTWLANCKLRQPNMTVLKVQCLLLIAKDCNWTQRNQAWTTTGLLVRQAMTAGLHREVLVNTDAPTKPSIYELEMRRRLWYTIVELDYRASLDRGMQPSVQESAYDCAPPSNLDDDAIRGEFTTYPEPPGLEVPTDTCFQAVMCQSLGLRLRICALINAPHIMVSPADLGELDAELTHFLSQVPDWENHSNGGRGEHVLWHHHIKCALRRIQVSLHSACILANLRGPYFSQCWHIRLETAAAMLHDQQRLVKRLGRIGWLEFREATLHANLAICHHLYADDQDDHDGGSRVGFGGPYASSLLLSRIIPSAAESLLDLVNGSRAILASKFSTLTKGNREHTLLALVINQVKTKLWPQQAAVFDKQFIEQVEGLMNDTVATLETAYRKRTNNESPALVDGSNGYPEQGNNIASATVMTPTIEQQATVPDVVPTTLNLFDFATFDDSLFTGDLYGAF